MLIRRSDWNILEIVGNLGAFTRTRQPNEKITDGFVIVIDRQFKLIVHSHHIVLL